MRVRRIIRALLWTALVAATAASLVLIASFVGNFSYQSARPPDTAVSTHYSTPTESLPGTGSAASPGPPEPEEPGQRAQRILDLCVKGRMAFRPPSPIKQGETVEFVVRVSMGSWPIDLGGGLPGTGRPSLREPTLCETVRADLTSSSRGLKIERSTGETVSLPELGMGEWGWHLTGLEPGQHQMVLRLVTPDPRGGDITVETFRETITVDVELMYSVSTWIRDAASPINAFLTVVATVGGWIAVVFTQRKRGKHEATSGRG